MGKNDLKSYDKSIDCPFFKARGSGEIRCEAPIDEANLRLYFKAWREYNFQRKLYCERKYRRCEIYRSVMNSKYNEEV